MYNTLPAMFEWTGGTVQQAAVITHQVLYSQLIVYLGPRTTTSSWGNKNNEESLNWLWFKHDAAANGHIPACWYPDWN